MIIFIYNNYFIINPFYRFLGFINLLIRKKVIDFFIITFFSFIIFFLSFLFYLSRLLYLPRYNKTYIKVYVKADKAYNNICDNLFYLFYSSRLSRYNKTYVKIYVKVYIKTYKIYNNTYDKCYYYNRVRFNNINKFNIKASFPPLLSLSSYLPRLSYYNKIYNKIYIKICVKTNKIYDNAYDKCYYYNKKKFNNINIFDIKNIITFFLIKFLSFFIFSKRDNSR